VTDEEWSRTVEIGLNNDPYNYQDITDNPWPFKTRNMRKKNEYIQFSKLSIWLACLQSVSKSCLLIQMTRPSDGINFTHIMNLFCRYIWVLTFFCRCTRAFFLDLFGSMILPNNNADSMPAVYLTFLEDMLNVPDDRYDWRQTILSYLYFNLSRSCLEPADCIAEPVLLLQMWSWTWFPIERPK
jgi:Plant mobile domain